MGLRVIFPCLCSDTFSSRGNAVRRNRRNRFVDRYLPRLGRALTAGTHEPSTGNNSAGMTGDPPTEPSPVDLCSFTGYFSKYLKQLRAVRSCCTSNRLPDHGRLVQKYCCQADSSCPSSSRSGSSLMADSREVIGSGQPSHSNGCRHRSDQSPKPASDNASAAGLPAKIQARIIFRAAGA